MKSIQTKNLIAKARTYLVKDFSNTPITDFTSVENDVSNKNVVETGILNRVKMIRNIGDATFKKENWVGIASEPSLHLGQLRMKEEAISK